MRKQEHEQSANTYMARNGLKSEAIRKAFLEGIYEGRRIENMKINQRIYRTIRAILGKS